MEICISVQVDPEYLPSTFFQHGGSSKVSSKKPAGKKPAKKKDDQKKPAKKKK